MIACRDLSPEVGTAAACHSLDIARATYYRRLDSGSENGASKRPAPPRALDAGERERVLKILHEDRFVDRAPTEIFASLLDEGSYLCSIRTMYRILAAQSAVRERRNQLRHPHYQAPELVATAPNQVWSWDITKLRGPVKWLYYYLYVIMDIFSRYVVGWMVAAHENGTLAKHLIAETCRKEGIEPGQIKLHADRGSPMIAKPVAMLMSDLGVTKSHSRPHVSNDNPFSEAHFKTLKYCPGFPDRFGSIVDGRGFCRDFFHWYNHEHRHGGIGLMTPATVHHGKVEAVTQLREVVLSEAFMAHPERFVRGMPQPPVVPEAAWINKPKIDSSESETSALPENDPNPGVVGYRPVRDRRSWDILEAAVLDQTSQVPQNDTKFESGVSQNH
jgi:putative transposase